MTATQNAESSRCCCDPVDVTLGRLPGARPPLRWWLPAAVFAAVALVLTLVIVLVVRSPGPLDDPRPADQRDGLLDNGPRLPAEIGGIAFGGRTVVVLFERNAPRGKAYEAWRASVTDDGVELIVRVGGDAALLATVVGMPTPVDGGAPVGYAVIDSNRLVRYATLDPTYSKNGFEVDVITRAVS